MSFWRVFCLFLNLSILAMTDALACSVCFGDSKSLMSRSIWPGVYFLLGLVGLVLAAIAFLGWSWIRKDSRGIMG